MVRPPDIVEAQALPTFTAPHDFSALPGLAPHQSAVADVDGDGFLDIVHGGRNAATVRILFGKGDSNFDKQDITTGTVTEPRGLAVGDIDGDGDLDIAIAGFNKVGVAYNTGNRTFQLGLAKDVVGSPGRSACVGDIDNDGREDVIVGTHNRDDGVHVFLSLGTDLMDESRVATGTLAEYPKLVDLDGDGALDIVAGDDGDDAFVVFGNGDGTFEDKTPIDSLTVGDNSYTFVKGSIAFDRDNDNDLDLVLVHNSGGSGALSCFERIGPPRAPNMFQSMSLPAGDGGLEVTTSDVNADGKPDLLTHAEGSSLRIFWHNGAGPGSLPWSDDNRTTLSAGATFRDVEAGDFNDDSKIDIASPNTNGSIVLYFSIIPHIRADVNGDGSVNLSDGIFISNWLFLGGPAPTCKETADANNDGATNISDSSYIYNFLFLGGPTPPPPFPTCGTQSDPLIPRFLGCESHTCI
jgi:hypothetical protein